MTVLFAFADESTYYIQCQLIAKEEVLPSELSLRQSIINNNYPSFSHSSSRELTLRSDEVANYDRVACLVETPQEKYCQPLMSYLPPDVVEESPDLTIHLKEQHEVDASIQVTVSIPCFVWCAAFPADQEPPEVKEIKRVKPVFIRDSNEVLFEHLTPSTAYKAYCYSESPLSSPMKYPIQSTEVEFSTKSGTFSYHQLKTRFNSI